MLKILGTKEDTIIKEKFDFYFARFETQRFLLKFFFDKRLKKKKEKKREQKEKGTRRKKSAKSEEVKRGEQPSTVRWQAIDKEERGTP